MHKRGLIKRGKYLNRFSKFLIPLFVVAFFPTAHLGLAFGTDEESQPFEAKLFADGVQRADVKVDSYSFEPNHIVVVVNKPVELTLKSVTKIIPHNFTINYPEAGLNVDQDIPHGKEVKVTFTPVKTGSFEFYCSKKGLFRSHQKRGMKGILEVRE